MTASIAESRPQPPHQPVLRRLVDLLAPTAPARTEPVLATTPLPLAKTADAAASVVAERVLRAAVEIVAGRRAARQLSAVLDPDLLAYLSTLKAAAGHLQPRVRKVLARPQADGALEVVALVTLNTGVRALAARFEAQVDDGDRRWRCTALQLRLTAGDVAIRRDRRIRRP